MALEIQYEGSDRLAYDPSRVSGHYLGMCDVLYDGYGVHLAARS